MSTSDSTVYPGLKTRLDQLMTDPKATQKVKNFCTAAYNVLDALDKRLDVLEGAPESVGGGGTATTAPAYDLPVFAPDSTTLTLNRVGNQVKQITEQLNAGGTA